MYFAENLKTLRTNNHLTQEELAKWMNLARSTIAGYEKKGRQPSYEVLERLAGFFHVSVDYLLTGRESGCRGSDPKWGQSEVCGVCWRRIKR